MSKMKILSIILLLACVVICIAVFMLPKDNVKEPLSNMQAEENINYSKGKISEGDFEEGIDEYWTVNATEGSVAVESSYSYVGENSLKIGLEEDYEANVIQHINGLKEGYYYIEARVLNDGNQEYCYIYGNGTAQGECMTAVPKGLNRETWRKVTVRGIKVESDGILEVGIRSKGNGQFLYMDNIRLAYESNQESQYESLYGGAISWLDWVEDKGGKYYFEDGTEADALQIMAENGCNFVRLELYNNPGEYINEYGDMFPAGYKDADAIFDLAVRAHNKGMKIQLSFMYSDYWGNECIPVDWAEKIEGITDTSEITEILSDCLYEYTKDFMERLAEAGIYPEYVSLGNEMSGGILTPYGSTYETEESLECFKVLMDAGYRAVKEVSEDSKIVLHIACNGDDLFWESQRGTGVWFFDLCEENDVKYDVIGTSYYPYWGQSDSEYAVRKAINVDDIVEWCDMMIDRYDKDILVMESGINWGTPGQLSNNGAYEGIYAYTPEGQRDFMYELINGLKSVKDGRCVGDLYWDPVLVRQAGIGWAVKENGGSRPNCVETTTFFDYNHIALPVLDAYRYNIISDGRTVLYGNILDAQGNVVKNTNVTINVGDSSYEVLTDRYGGYYLYINENSGSVSVDGGESYEINVACGDRVKLDLVK